MKNKSSLIFFAGITAMLLILGAALICMPQASFSETENRYLTNFEKPSVSGFLDTSFQDKLTKGANDQFPARDVWMKLSVELQRAIGLSDVGGVYFGKDGCYFERVLDSQISESRYLNQLRYLEQFCEKSNASVTFLPVPSAGAVLADKLPKNTPLYDSDKLYGRAGQRLKQVRFLDIRPQLQKERERSQLYFKTDHHWTMEGAYQAYAAWCQENQIAPKELGYFKPKKQSDAFFGTLYSKAPIFGAKPDKLTLPMNLPGAEVSIDEKKRDGLRIIYDWEKLYTKDKYGVYFGGNFGRVDIHTGNSNGKKLLIIKDSFANSFVPFLMPHYETITMLDFRYFNESVLKLAQRERFREALVLYEMSNFAQDMNFFKLLK